MISKTVRERYLGNMWIYMCVWNSEVRDSLDMYTWASSVYK